MIMGILIAFAMATEPNNQSSCELHLRTEATIRVTPTATPTIDDAVQVTSKDVTERDGNYLSPQP